MFSRKMLAKMIDYTVLRPDLSREEMVDICEAAKAYHFAAIVVQPFWIRVVARELEGTDVKTCTPIGFPYGTTSISTKIIEAKSCIAGGANEIEVILNIAAVKSRKLRTARQDIREVVNVARESRLTRDGSGEILVKLAIEAGWLTDDELRASCDIGCEAGVDFVKTCSGYGPRGATLDDIRKIRAVVGREIGVKAAGGIGTLRDALKMLDAGANRIGASAAVSIVDEAPDEDDENFGRRRRRRRRKPVEAETPAEADVAEDSDDDDDEGGDEG